MQRVARVEGPLGGDWGKALATPHAESSQGERVSSSSWWTAGSPGSFRVAEAVPPVRPLFLGVDALAVQLPAKIERFLDTVTRWARQQPDVVALVLVGSYARGAGTSSSDIDLVLLTDQPDNYLKSTEWVKVFGHPQGQSTEVWGKVTSDRKSVV